MLDCVRVCYFEVQLKCRNNASETFTTHIQDKPKKDQKVDGNKHSKTHFFQFFVCFNDSLVLKNNLFSFICAQICKIEDLGNKVRQNYLKSLRFCYVVFTGLEKTSIVQQLPC